jgi:hypothetical protein
VEVETGGSGGVAADLRELGSARAPRRRQLARSSDGP